MYSMCSMRTIQYTHICILYYIPLCVFAYCIYIINGSRYSAQRVYDQFGHRY